MSEVSFSSWNINQALSLNRPSDEKRRDSIYNYVKQNPVDFHFFVEAYGGVDETLPAEVRAEFESMGYVVGDCPHDDFEREAANPSVQKGVVWLSKLAITKSEIVNFDGERNLPLVQFETADKQTGQFLGVHLDDRTEYGRWRQTRAIINQFANSSDNLIIGGDFNSMPKNSQAARALQLADFKNWAMTERDARLASVLQRSVQMAIGGAYLSLTRELNLMDADSRLRPTITMRQKGITVPAHIEMTLQEFGIKPDKAMFKLDHFLAGENYHLESFELEDVPLQISDHLAIRAMYTLSNDR